VKKRSEEIPEDIQSELDEILAKVRKFQK